MQTSLHTIDDLKSSGQYFAAGALAAALGLSRDSYGCHFGMRSELESARCAYMRGWTAAKKEMEGAANVA